MASLSVCMIVRDEENLLPKSLNSILPLMDELVIVDTGSKDQTKEIAQKFTNKVYDFEWIEDFAKARNFGLKFATKKYVLFWDADFLIDKQSLNFLKKLKSKNFENFDILSFIWQTSEDILVPRNFLFKNKDFIFEHPIHEELINITKKPFKHQFYSQIKIQHLPEVSKRPFRNQQNQQILKKALQKSPNSLYLLSFLIADCFDQKDFEQTIDLIQKYLNLEPSFDRQIMVIEKLIFCYLNLQNLQKAKETVEKYYPKFSKNPIFLLIYADVMVFFDPKLALESYQNYLRLGFGPKDTKFPFSIKRNLKHPNEMISNLQLQF
jgi:glycosyltransferase involved in cell wall biosynthesis